MINFDVVVKLMHDYAPVAPDGLGVKWSDVCKEILFVRINHLRRMADQAKYFRACRSHLLRSACRLLDFEIACLREIARLRESMK